ncbi:MAG: N-acetyltransferase, partial [Chloroflexota bacterium]
MGTNQTQTLSTVRLRPAQWTDINGVAQLILDVCTADGDPTVADSVEDLQKYWSEPGFNLELDTWVAETPDGRIVGYEEFYDRHAHAALEGDGYVHPDFLGQGIGTAMLRAMEARAREVMKLAESDLCVRIRNGMAIGDTRSREMHENEGYRPVRFSWRMEINLDEAPPAPQWPRGIELRPFAAEKHARLVFDAVEDAFRDHWGHTPMRYEVWKENHLGRESFDPTLWFIAWDGDQIAGTSLCRYRNEVGWVGMLGVRPAWRRLGLARALLLHSFAEFYQRGMKTIGLGVDAQNPNGATKLYQSAGMKVAAEYVIYEKELHPGR